MSSGQAGRGLRMSSGQAGRGLLVMSGHAERRGGGSRVAGRLAVRRVTPRGAHRPMRGTLPGLMEQPKQRTRQRADRQNRHPCQVITISCGQPGTFVVDNG
jgi:hypothetical protein